MFTSKIAEESGYETNNKIRKDQPTNQAINNIIGIQAFGSSYSPIIVGYSCRTSIYAAIWIYDC